MSRRLRIVHVVASGRFAGVERSVALTSGALAALGHEVTVIGGAPEQMSFHLSGSGVRWLPSASLAEAMRGLIRNGSSDIVHAHMTAAEIAAILALPRTRGRLFVTRHFAQRRGLGAGRFARPLIERVPRNEISISRFVAERIGCPSSVVHHGIPNCSAVALDRKRVLVVQRLEPEKHTGLAIEAWATSGLGERGWELAIAGDGQERAELLALARREGVDSSVRFLGHVTDVAELRRSAVLQIATPPGEHFGLSVLEAMACGLPVVAADGGAHREVLGDDALYFEPGSADGLAKLLSVVEDPGPLRQIGVRLQERQRSEFSIEAHGLALEQSYLAALTP